MRRYILFLTFYEFQRDSTACSYLYIEWRHLEDFYISVRCSTSEVSASLIFIIVIE